MNRPAIRPEESTAQQLVVPDGAVREDSDPGAEGASYPHDRDRRRDRGG
jgi:hypothetical protein